MLTRSGFIAGGSAYLGQVATRTVLPDQKQTAFQQMRGTRTHFARDNITSLKIAFPNFYVDGFHAGATYQELGTGSSATITASIEYPVGTIAAQVTFAGGSTSGTIPNLSILYSDTIPVTIPTGATFRIRYYWTHATCVLFLQGASTGTNIGQNRLVGDNVDFATTGLSDNTMGGTYTATTGSSGYSPALILGTTTKSSVMIIGDSLAYGEDDTGDTGGDVGGVARAIGPSFAYASFAFGGDAMVRFASFSTLRRSMLPYFTHTINELGINDFIAQGRTATQLATDTTTVGTLLASKKNFICTMFPSATTTDNFATLVNQTTAAYTPSMITENNRRRGIPANYIGCFDFSDALSSSRDSGLIKAGQSWYNSALSSLHPIKAGYVQASTAITTSSILYP